MKLGVKINITLIFVATAILGLSFFVILDAEKKNFKQDVLNDSTAAIDVLRVDIEKLFLEIRTKQIRMQDIADRLKENTEVSYIETTNKEYKYIVSTNIPLIGKKPLDTKINTLEKIQKEHKELFIREEKNNSYEITKYAPILEKINGTTSVVGILEVKTSLSSKNSANIRGAEISLNRVTDKIKAEIEVDALSNHKSTIALQSITDRVNKFRFFYSLIIFDEKFNVIANTDGKLDFENTPEHQQVLKNVLTGAISEGNLEQVDDGNSVIVYITPISLFDQNNQQLKNIGLIEAHILKESYEQRIDSLSKRMLFVDLTITIITVLLLAVVLNRLVIAPIRRYSVLARKVADGDLDQRVDHFSNDEIGQFGDVFNSMVASIRELDHLKSDFISVAAHQLRTPLSGVKWVLKLLIDGDLGSINDAQKSMLKRGYETNEKMIQLVNDLLNVSRIENGKFGYKFEKNDFLKIIKTLMDNAELASKERNIEIRFDNRAGVVPEFLFDAEKILIALQNLVDNAMKYTLPGGHVKISLERQGDFLEIKVSDTGVGVPKEEVAKLFSKFFRASNVVYLQTDGSGLGLFIVKSIITRHGGQVWVDSEEGKGTTFTVVIPVVAELLPREDAPGKILIDQTGGASGTTI